MSTEYHDEHYDPEWIAQHQPTAEVIDGKLYLDGVPVARSQMTPEEIKKYFPEQYFRDYTRLERPCPLCQTAFVVRSDKQSFISHLRLGHPKWYEAHRERLAGCENGDQLLGFARGVLYTNPKTTEIDDGSK